MKTIEIFLLILLVTSSAFSQVEKEKIINEEKIIIDKKEPVRFSKQMKGTFNGKRMNYLNLKKIQKNIQLLFHHLM